MKMSIVYKTGRLCNEVIKNLGTSIIAEKHNLKVSYYNKEKVEKLGIKLYEGDKVFDKSKELTVHNYVEILNDSNLNYNLNVNETYLQDKDCCNIMYEYLNKNKDCIISVNKFKEFYNNNNDCFMHIRLTDAAQYNPGINYYLNALSKVNFHTLYIATDDFRHPIIKEIIDKYGNYKFVLYDEVDTIHFGSTIKNIILSHGSFSAIIGYLAFYSTVFYPRYDKNKIWHGDMFSIPGWNEVDY